jgi:hypothetical protein
MSEDGELALVSATPDQSAMFSHSLQGVHMADPSGWHSQEVMQLMTVEEAIRTCLTI